MFERENPCRKSKKAIITFHYTEKIKSSLIVTARLLDVLQDMKDEEISGAERLLVAYLNALIHEVNIAASVSGVQGFKDVNVKLEDIIKQTQQRNYVNVMRLASEATSITTTNGIKAAETLKEKGLI